MRTPASSRGLGDAARLALCLTLASTGVARAQDDTPAVALFEEAAEHYRAGRFARAAELLREAYTRRPEPVLLYNLARALEGAGEDEEAAEHYERYLDNGATGDDAAAARARLEILQRRIDERRQLEAQARAAAHLGMEVQPVTITSAEDPTPWILAGAGGGLLVIGGVLGGLMLERASVARDAPVHATAAQALVDAEGLAIAADAFFAIGALLTGIGLIWGIGVAAGDEPETGAAVTAALRIGPGSVALRVSTP